MNNLLNDLFKGSTRFYLNKTDFTNYAILYALANTDSEWKDKANSILIRASLREPMDLDVEAEKLFLEIMYAKVKQ